MFICSGDVGMIERGEILGDIGGIGKVFEVGEREWELRFIELFRYKI